jgi:hypothetical protein
MNDDFGAGRFCPADYRYPPASFARQPEFEAETLYVVGGLYGNPLALDAIERMAEGEAGEIDVVFNGDFHWFDIDPHDFATVQRRVLSHRATRGNVETELSRSDDEARAGCGCAYPESVPDADVDRSNTILHTLRRTASELAACRDELTPLPMHVVGRVGRCKIGIVHGDAESLAGWRFGHEALDDEANGPWLREISREAAVDLFASSHTCRPVMRSFAFNGARLAIANNGAAGLPNFADTHFGVITRISVRPVEGRRLYGMRIASTFVDAVPVEFDQTQWLRKFESKWPPDSPAYVSYHSRIVNGPPFSIASAAPMG